MAGRIVERSRISWEFDPDDDDRDLARYGLRTGDTAFRIVLQGEQDWDGWVVWLWGVESDSPRTHRFGGFYHLVVRNPPTDLWVWLVRAEARRCRGQYGGPNYRDEPAVARVEWGGRGSLPGRLSLLGLPFTPGSIPDLAQLSIPLTMLQAKTVMGRRPGAGAAFKTEDEYRTAIRTDVIARAASQGWHLENAEDWQIADWLGISKRTMFKYNARWRISLDDIRHRRA